MADTSSDEYVELTYFKDSGKYYTGDTIPWEQVKAVLVDDEPPPFKVFGLVRAYQRHGKLPGLASGTWTGPILIGGEWPGGYPHLLMPDTDTKEH